MGLTTGPIGVFDSGFGGLEVLKHIVKKLPQYDYLYLGDTARTPYGSRSQEVIFNFTEQAVDFLFKQPCFEPPKGGCPLVILACNTASSEALRKIQQKYSPLHQIKLWRGGELKKYSEKKVLGVIIPAVEKAIELTKNNRVGVIATEGTVNSLAFKRELKKRDPQVKVFQSPAPLLVPIVEAGEHNTEIAEIILQKYLKPFLIKKIDTLILGCTHYGILEKQIIQVVGQDIAVISEGRVVAEKLADYLQRHSEIEARIAKNGQVRFLTTDLTDKFQKLAGQFFGRPIKPEIINLG